MTYPPWLVSTMHSDIRASAPGGQRSAHGDGGAVGFSGVRHRTTTLFHPSPAVTTSTFRPSGSRRRRCASSARAPALPGGNLEYGVERVVERVVA